MALKTLLQSLNAGSAKEDVMMNHEYAVLDQIRGLHAPYVILQLCETLEENARNPRKDNYMVKRL